MERFMNDPLEIPYFFSFRLFDINNDEVICSRDIFQLMLLIQDYPFLEADILRLVHYKGTYGESKLKAAEQKYTRLAL